MSPQRHNLMQSIKSEIEMQCVLSTFNRDNKSLGPLYRRANAKKSGGSKKQLAHKCIIIVEHREPCGKWHKHK